MGVPQDKDAKRFYRAAGQRLDDAAHLMDAARTTAAVYLAGYCVECMWKALIVTQAGKDKTEEVLALFRGAHAHDFAWLRSLFARHGGLPPSKKDKALVNALVVVGSWSTNLRYDPGTIPEDDAAEFVTAAQRFQQWADERL